MRPCPFCGEKEKIKVKKDVTYFMIVCKACGAEGPMGNSPKDAELQWENRP